MKFNLILALVGLAVLVLGIRAIDVYYDKQMVAEVGK